MQAVPEAAQQVPIFIGHGADDEKVSVTLSKRTADGLRKSGAFHQASCHHCVRAKNK